MLSDFISFYLTAKTKYQVHSPFVYAFLIDLLEDDRHYYAFNEIDDLQWHLKQQNKKTTIRPFFGELLFKLILHHQPKYILELGTSFGINTAYLAASDSDINVVTIEKNLDNFNLSKKNFTHLKISHKIKAINADYENGLSQAIHHLDNQLDVVCFNEYESSTINHFETCLEQAHEDSIFIFNNSYQSAESKRTWLQVQQHSKVRLTLDLFFMSIVFFRNEQREVEHFKLVPQSWKPWAIW